MALTGSMRDFGVSEIFQLIGHQKKSGVLTVTDKKMKVEILFDSGNIVKAEAEPFSELFDLAATIERSGLVQTQKIEAARQEAQRSLKPLPQVLLSAELIKIEDLRAVIRLVHQEIIYSLFLWKDGDYSFDQGAVNYTAQWTDPIASEGVLMDGYRIKDEWPLVVEAIPDFDLPLAKVPGDFGPDDKLGREESEIYTMVNGKRTAMDMVFITRMGQFEALKVIRDLIEKERIKVVGAKAGPAKKEKSGALLKAAAAAIVVAGLGAAGLGGFRNYQRIAGPGVESKGLLAHEIARTLHNSDRVAGALALEAALGGKYPDSLEAIPGSMLPRRSLKTPWGKFEYSPGDGNESYTLLVPEPEESGRIPGPGSGGGDADTAPSELPGDDNGSAEPPDGGDPGTGEDPDNNPGDADNGDMDPPGEAGGTQDGGTE